MIAESDTDSCWSLNCVHLTLIDEKISPVRIQAVLLGLRPSQHLLWCYWRKFKILIFPKPGNFLLLMVSRWGCRGRICLTSHDPWDARFYIGTRSSWLNCALRDDEAVHWISIGHYEAVAVGNWWYCVSRGHLCLYILQKVEIWKGVTHASLTDWLTDNFER